MILYHFNLGYPLLSAKSYLLSPTVNVTPRDEIAAVGIDDYKNFQLPTQDYNEQVFYHDLKGDEEGKTFAALINPIQKLGVAISFNKNQLNRMAQWKQMGEGDYVLGIEPANCHVEGRATARKDGTLQFIAAGEVRHFNTIIEIIDGEEKIQEYKNRTEELLK